MIHLGNTAISKAYVGSVEAEKIYLGNTEVWSNFTPQGMDKSGDQTTSALSWTLISNWVIRSGFPGTVITSDGLVVAGGKSVTIYAQTLRGGSNAGNQVRLYNATAGSVLATGSSGGDTPNVSHTFTPSVDTHIQLQSYASGTVGNRHIVIGGTSSYMTAVAA
jgi:hypothetical protein